MILPLKNRDRGVAQIIIRRLSGYDDYESMKHANAEGPDKLLYAKKPMSDCDGGMDQCCHDMISAFEQKDSKMLKHALKSFIKMALQEHEQDSELEESSKY